MISNLLLTTERERERESATLCDMSRWWGRIRGRDRYCEWCFSISAISILYCIWVKVIESMLPVFHFFHNIYKEERKEKWAITKQGMDILHTITTTHVVLTVCCMPYMDIDMFLLKHFYHTYINSPQELFGWGMHRYIWWTSKNIRLRCHSQSAI